MAVRHIYIHTHNDDVRLSKVFVIVIRVTGFFSSWQLAAQFLTPFNRALNLSSSLYMEHTAAKSPVYQTDGIIPKQLFPSHTEALLMLFQVSQGNTCALGMGSQFL